MENRLHKYRKQVLIASLLFIGAALQFAHAQQKVAEWLSDSIIQRYQPTIDVLTHHGWDHSNSIVMHAMAKVYLQTNNPQYLAYVQKYADDYINADGSINGLLTTLDGMHPAVLCLFLYQQTGDKKYQKAATTMRDHLLGKNGQKSQFNKTQDGIFWHKNNAKYQDVASVDGLYMKDPFLVRYGLMFDQAELVDASVEQVLKLAQRSFNIRTNLAFHAWDATGTRDWADPITGQATQHWSRASGWFAMALVDILEYLPKSHPDYNKVAHIFQRLALGLKNAQHRQNGLWYQVLDQAHKPDNYPEISGSGMIVYALTKGVQLQLLADEYAQIAQKAWVSMQDYIKTYSDGGPQITSVAPGMSSKLDYAAYVAVKPIEVPRSQTKQYSHGYVGVLMAASVIEYQGLNNSAFVTAGS